LVDVPHKPKQEEAQDEIQNVQQRARPLEPSRPAGHFLEVAGLGRSPSAYGSTNLVVATEAVGPPVGPQLFSLK
jgi:hypothetical protein